MSETPSRRVWNEERTWKGLRGASAVRFVNKIDGLIGNLGARRDLCLVGNRRVVNGVDLELQRSRLRSNRGMYPWKG